MNKIKQLVLTSALALSTLSASAERWRIQDFMNSGYTSITVSNTIPLTNILSVFSFSTNTVGIIFTNSGVFGYTTNADFRAFFHDVGTSPGVDSYRSHTNALATARLVASVTSGSIGAAESCIITLSPVFDGLNEATTATERWGFGVVGVNGTTVTVATNPPSWLLDATALRVVSVVSTSTNASVGLRSLKLVDWVQ